MSQDFIKNAEYYVYVSIADFSIASAQKTNFSNYVGYANYIHEQLTKGNYQTVCSYIFDISQEVSELYGFSSEDSLTYIVKYFHDKLWETYYKPVDDVRKHFGKFLSV